MANTIYIVIPVLTGWNSPGIASIHCESKLMGIKVIVVDDGSQALTST
jgi:hypothetical protein